MAATAAPITNPETDDQAIRDHSNWNHHSAPQSTGDLPRRFKLFRRHDASGVSGTGTVAWGTLYPNGKVSLAWCGDRPSINVYDSIADVEAIHGHDGSTTIVMFDDLTVTGGFRSPGSRLGW